MSNEVVKYENSVLSVNDIKEQSRTIARVLKDVMIKDVHYGKVPGCGDKPVLLKSGAEKILTTFRLSVKPEIIDLSTDDCARFRVICHGGYMPTGNYIGGGIGEASTNEKKWKWRKAVCEEEYENTDESRRQIAWVLDKYGNAHEVKQVRTNHADLANTVLKMAKKRALVDLTLTATACSDIFEQDIEEIEDGETKPEVRNPQDADQKRDAPPPANAISEAQRKRLFAITSQSNKSQDQLKEYLVKTHNIDNTAHIPKAVYEQVVNWVQDVGQVQQ